MKKFLSMALALIMVLTTISLMTVSVSAAGTTERIVIFKEDFSGADTNKISVTGLQKKVMLKDATGDRYLFITPNDTLAAAKSIATQSRGSKGRIGSDFWYEQIQANLGFKLNDDRDIIVTYDNAMINADGNITKPSWGTVIFDASSLSVDGKTYKSGESYTGTGFTNTAMSGNSARAGWYTATKSTDSWGWASSAGTVGTNGYTPSGEGTLTFIGHRNSLFGMQFAALLTENKLYCGTGNDTKVEYYDSANTAYPIHYKFTLTEDDIKGDEKALLASGTHGGSNAVYYEKGTDEYNNIVKSLIYEDDGTTLKQYSLATDCSALDSATRYAKLQELLAKEKIGFYIDNYQVTANATVYEDTVKVGAHGCVTATTNTATGEEVTVEGGNTASVKVNDFFGVTYTITPDMGYDIDTVTYGGETVTVSNNKYTVAASAVSGKELAVTFKMKTAAYSYTRRYLANFKGGTKVENGVKSADGNTTLTINKAEFYDENTVNTEEGYFLWTGASNKNADGSTIKNADGSSVSERSRIIIKFLNGSHKTASNRQYNLVLGVTNDDGIASFGTCTTQWDGASSATVYKFDGTSVAGQKINSALVVDTGKGYYGDSKGSVPAYASEITYVYRTYSASGRIIPALATDPGYAYYFNTTSFQSLGQCAYGVLPKIYEVGMDETLTMYPVLFSGIGDGSIEASNKSLNFGTETGTYTSAEKIDIESNMGADFTLTAPAGKLVETVTFSALDGTTTVLKAAGDNKAAVSFGLKEVVKAGTISATYVDAENAPSFGQSGFINSNGFKDKEVSNNGSIVKISADYSVTAYATIDVGYGSTINEYGIELVKVGKNDSAPLVLKAVGEKTADGQFAIMAYGAAVNAGTYKAKSYVKYTDSEGNEGVAYGEEKTAVLN